MPNSRHCTAAGRPAAWPWWWARPAWASRGCCRRWARPAARAPAACSLPRGAPAMRWCPMAASRGCCASSPATSRRRSTTRAASSWRPCCPAWPRHLRTCHAAPRWSSRCASCCNARGPASTASCSTTCTLPTTPASTCCRPCWPRRATPRRCAGAWACARRPRVRGCRRCWRRWPPQHRWCRCRCGRSTWRRWPSWSTRWPCTACVAPTSPPRCCSAAAAIRCLRWRRSSSPGPTARWRRAPTCPARSRWRS